MGANNTWNHEDEPEESEAMQGCDGALRFDSVHRFESGGQMYTRQQSSQAT
jgi:hypothetical protein